MKLQRDRMERYKRKRVEQYALIDKKQNNETKSTTRKITTHKTVKPMTNNNAIAMMYDNTYITPGTKNKVANKHKNSNIKENDGGVSICLSAWNTQDYIEECLDSIANQTWFKTHDNWEILLGIDACEETLAKVKQIMYKYKNLSVYMMNENVGTYVTCNTVMKLARYDWLLRFDTDDIMPNDMLDKIFKNNLKGVDFIRYSHKDFGIKENYGLAWGSHMVRREIWEKFGGYRNWRISGDYDFLYRIEPQTHHLKLNTVFYLRRCHINSLEHNKSTDMKSELRKKLNTFVVTQSRNEKIIQCTTTLYEQIFIIPETITFIIPNRGGSNLKYVLDNIERTYKEYNHEIIVIEQKDNNIFKKGQLYNIAIQKSNSDFIALCDNDIIHIKKIDLIGEYYKENKPYLGFDYISQCKIEKGKPVITLTQKNETGGGAFLFASKEDLLNCNGFSNLYLGWGCEDNEIVCRLMNDNNSKPSIRHIHNTIGHITHPKRMDDSIFNRNRNIFYSRMSRKIKEDGILQTTFELVSEYREKKILYIEVKNIGVNKDFKYKDLL